MRNRAQVPDDQDGSAFILRLGFPRISHLNYGIPHVVVAVHHIDDNLLTWLWGTK